MGGLLAARFNYDLTGKFRVYDLLELTQWNSTHKAVTIDEKGGGAAYGRFAIFRREVGSQVHIIRHELFVLFAGEAFFKGFGIQVEIASKFDVGIHTQDCAGLVIHQIFFDKEFIVILPIGILVASA